MNETEHKGLFFNEINKLSNINSRFHRISSMLIDHMILTLTLMVIVSLTLILFLIFTKTGTIEMGISMVEPLLFSIIIVLYTNKDFFNAKSPGKRILGYQVVDKKTNMPATELQCFIRNLTILIIWPLEVLTTYINPKRRIGDFIANTKVVKAEKEKLKSLLSDLKNKKLKLSFLLILFITVIYIYGLNFVMSSIRY